MISERLFDQLRLLIRDAIPHDTKCGDRCKSVTGRLLSLTLTEGQRTCHSAVIEVDVGDRPIRYWCSGASDFYENGKRHFGRAFDMVLRVIKRTFINFARKPAIVVLHV